jgi:hypothetical protein
LTNSIQIDSMDIWMRSVTRLTNNQKSSVAAQWPKTK